MMPYHWKKKIGKFFRCREQHCRMQVPAVGDGRHLGCWKLAAHDRSQWNLLAYSSAYGRLLASAGSANMLRNPTAL